MSEWKPPKDAAEWTPPSDAVETTDNPGGKKKYGRFIRRLARAIWAALTVRTRAFLAEWHNL